MAGEKKTSELTLDATPGAGSYVPYVDPTEAADADKNKRILFSDVDSAAGLVIGTDVQAFDAANVTDTSTSTLTNKTIVAFDNTVAADELHVQVYNNSGVLLAAGTPVYMTGYNFVGTAAPTVAKADASSAATMPCIGITNEVIGDGSFGEVVISGFLNSINTSAFSNGDVLYVSETAGELTATPPVPDGTNVKQAVAVVLYAAGGGKLQVLNYGVEVAASETAKGNVELATIAEIDTGTDTLRAITPAGLAGSALSGNVTTNNAKVSNATHTGDVTGSTALTIATNAVTTAKINAAAVTSAKLANMAQSTVKGRAAAAGTGVPVDLTATQLRTIINVEAGADVTDTANVTAAGALMDSEVDADIKTLSLPASTTISAFGATLVDDADAGTARATLGAVADYVAPVNVTGTTDTMAAADHGVTVWYSNASAVTVTLPTDAADDLDDGFWCMLVSTGAGGLTLSTAGVTLLGSPNTTISTGEGLFVQKTAAANSWLVLGGTAA